VSETPARLRGRLWLYAVAFALLVGAGAALIGSAVGFLASTRLLWVSTFLSAAAIAAAILGVMLPRR
jgi:hypothetical protein